MLPRLQSAVKTQGSRSSLHRVLLFASIVWVSAHTAAADESHPKLDPALRAAVDQSPTDTLQVIVTAKTPNLAPVRAHVLNSGNSIKAEHPFIHALTAKLRARDVAEFEADRTVDHLSLDHPVRSTGAPPAKKGGNGGTIDEVALTLATLGLPNGDIKGSGVGVA